MIHPISDQQNITLLRRIRIALKICYKKSERKKSSTSSSLIMYVVYSYELEKKTQIDKIIIFIISCLITVYEYIHTICMQMLEYCVLQNPWKPNCKYIIIIQNTVVVFVSQQVYVQWTESKW